MGSLVALRSHEMHEHLQFCARTKEPGPPADERGLCSSEAVLQAAGRAPLPANRQVTFFYSYQAESGFHYILPDKEILGHAEQIRTADTLLPQIRGRSRFSQIPGALPSRPGEFPLG